MPFSFSKARFWRKSRSDRAAHVQQKDPHQRSSQDRRQDNHQPNSHGEKKKVTTTTTPSNLPDDLWVAAEQRLRQDEKMDRVMNEAVAILEEFGMKLVSDSTARRHQLTEFLDARVEELEQKKWIVRVGGYSVGVQDQLTRMFQNVLLFKDLITTAAAASPPAAIACASMTISIQLFIQASEQHDQLLNGLETASALVPRLHAMERLYLHSDVALGGEFLHKFTERVILLYSKVLELQARALSYFRKRSFSRMSRDIIKKDPWSALLQHMNHLEREVQSFEALIDKADTKETNKKIHEQFQTAAHGFQAWQTESARDEKVNKLLKVLYTCMYRDRKDRNPKRVAETCRWFTDHPRFQAWTQGLPSLLWVSADPGCGKSVLARYLVDEVLSAGQRTICYFFFKDDFDDQKSSASAICSILRQLFLAKPQLVPDSLLQRVDTDGDRLATSFADLWSIFVAASTSPSAGEVFCVIDALDECRDADRPQFIQAVTEFYGSGTEKCNLKLLITSRPYGHIRSAFQDLEDQMPTIHLSGEGEPEVQDISREIDLVIASRVKDISKKKCLDPDERMFLQEQLTAVKNRTYLWVSLTIDFIEGIPGFTKGNVRRVVREIPCTVDAAYNKILSRSPDPAKATRLLHIIMAAKRPFSLQELSLCMALRGENQSKQDIMDEKEPVERFKTTVRDLCGLILTIIEDKIYLLHQTVKEFLVQNQPISRHGLHSWKHALLPAESNKILAEICVWYLFASMDETVPHSLYKYSVCQWPVHFRESSTQSQENIAALGARLCSPETTIYRHWSYEYDGKLPSLGTPLITAAFLGLEAVARLLIESDPTQANSLDYHYRRTPLSWAACQGHEAVVSLLLDTGKVDINHRDYSGSTPLIPALLLGHEGVVRLLLAAKADVNIGPKRVTPLALALKQGQSSIVHLLLHTADFDTNTRATNKGWSPFSWAALVGNREIVRLLLDTGKADVDSEEFGNRTPLSYAALRGDEVIVRMLLETGKVNINHKGSQYGQSAFSWAARFGRTSVVQTLLENEQTEINTRDRLNRTPLSWASEGGHEPIVQLLLKTGRVEVDARDSEGRTPLSHAAEFGYRPVVKLLLDTGAVQVDIKDSMGRTPLSWAKENGHESVAQMLRDASRSYVQQNAG